MRGVNIKSIYYCLEDMVNIKDFHSNLVKIDKKSHRGTNIYYIGYNTIKKIGDFENIRSMNQLRLTNHSATGCFKEKKTLKNT